jgi:hypothetical protein
MTYSYLGRAQPTPGSNDEKALCRLRMAATFNGSTTFDADL